MIKFSCVPIIKPQRTSGFQFLCGNLWRPGRPGVLSPQYQRGRRKQMFTGQCHLLSLSILRGNFPKRNCLWMEKNVSSDSCPGIFFFFSKFKLPCLHLLETWKQGAHEGSWLENSQLSASCKKEEGRELPGEKPVWMDYREGRTLDTVLGLWLWTWTWAVRVKLYASLSVKEQGHRPPVFPLFSVSCLLLTNAILEVKVIHDGNFKW